MGTRSVALSAVMITLSCRAHYFNGFGVGDVFTAPVTPQDQGQGTSDKGCGAKRSYLNLVAEQPLSEVPNPCLEMTT